MDAAMPSHLSVKHSLAIISQAMKHSRMQKANVRALETPEQTLSRQETDKARKTRKKASETQEQGLQRKRIVKECICRCFKGSHIRFLHSTVFHCLKNVCPASEAGVYQ